jgi:dTDP-glucose 4,6-dehydratase
MKALIIGSNSFYGSHYTKLLIKKKFKVIGISRSKIKKNCLLAFDKKSKNFNFFQLNLNTQLLKIFKIIKKFKPNYIINFSSQSMVNESWKSPQDWFLTNSYSVPYLYNLLNQLTFKFKLVHISTPEIYGSTKNLITENEKINPSTPYAISRVNADFFLQSLKREFNFNFVGIRAANIYGEYQDLYRIIPKTIYSIMNKKQIFLHGGGRSVRSFIHIDDVCNGTYLVMKKKETSGQFYHISSKKLISIKNLIKKICKIYKYDYSKIVKESKDRIGKDKFYKLKTKKIEKFGWKAKVTLDDGIRRTGAWLKKNKKNFSNYDLFYQHKK